jgi:uncharacterized membrane protein
LKIRTLNTLIAVDILTILLLVFIYFIPLNNIVRIVLGLPFLLFFPGYALMTALLGKSVDTLERTALSVITSVAVVGLIGFGLNYTTSGITLHPAIYSIGGFIGLTSIAGYVRLSLLKEIKLANEVRISRSDGLKKTFTNPFTLVLVGAVVISLGALGYSVVAFGSSEKYTEFYILGLNGKADNYPVEFLMQNNQTYQVNYDSGIDSTTGEWGKITLGIVNNEKTRATYSVEIKIDGEVAKINDSGNLAGGLNSIELQPGSKWEKDIEFSPTHSGDNQKVEFQLFKDKSPDPDNTLQLWIKAHESAP